MCAARPRCELCGAGADVRCEADAAFLCAPCDAEVHAANFLAFRHRRTRVSPPPGADAEDALSRTSTADSATTAPPAAKGEAVLEGWARRMGLEPGAARRRAAAAARSLRAQVAAARTTSPPRVPLRVAMAAVLWWEVAAHGGVKEPGEALRRLEACARVPARLLMAAESCMVRGRAMKRPATEGWGECSPPPAHKHKTPRRLLQDTT